MDVKQKVIKIEDKNKYGKPINYNKYIYADIGIKDAKIVCIGNKN